MRAFPISVIAFAAVFLSSAGARADGTWCAHYVLHTNCGFYSFAQCAATLSGNGGFCSRNQYENNPSWTDGNTRRRNRRDY
jgi:hypothetical protein